MIYTIKWNAKKTVKEFDELTGKMIKVRRPSEPELHKGKHDAVISEELFKRAQSRFNKQPSTNIRKEIKNPLATLLCCCECGKTMAYHPFTKRTGTGGRLTHPPSTLCYKKSISFEACMSALVEALKMHVADFEIKLKEDNNKEELARHKKRIKSLETELAKQEKMKRRLFDSWEADDGTYTKDEFIERKQKYTAAISSLKAQIEELKESAPAPVDYRDKIRMVHELIDTLQDSELSAAAKNNILKEYIEVIKFDIIDHGRNKGGTPVLEVVFK